MSEPNIRIKASCLALSRGVALHLSHLSLQGKHYRRLHHLHRRGLGVMALMIHLHHNQSTTTTIIISCCSSLKGP
ncbi:hypothetical protein E2C01_008957 [Portunus trituberculatus]|uniref:Uncharacterized protein n=1 Tax=Portunus trituberculatus TaxID=210409 RepID=A0A5B7D262_PORTR|nr:hypothetical protein [Portunus trituberculatus]